MKDMCIIHATKVVFGTTDHMQCHEQEIQHELFSVHFTYIRTPGWSAEKVTIIFTEFKSLYLGYMKKATEVLLANLKF